MRAVTQARRDGPAGRVEPRDLNFQEGYSKGEEWVQYTGEAAEVGRLKRFCRELSLNGETPAMFVDLNAA